MALRLAEESAAVMCADVNEQAAQSTAARVEEIGAKGAAIGLDVADSAAFAAALSDTASRLGGLDVLMNNAGVGGLNP